MRVIVRHLLVFALSVSSAVQSAFAQTETITWGNTPPGPIPVPTLAPGLSFVQLTSGRSFTAGLVSDGSISAWGDNTGGQCNVQALPAGVTYVEVSAGDFWCMARRSDGAVVQWGSFIGGGPPPLPPGLTYVQISAGYDNALALLSDGSVVAWGSDWTGQSSVPPLPPGLTYVQVSAGYSLSMLLRSDGSITAFGYGDHGGTDVPALPPGLTYTHVYAGDSCGYAVRSDGSLIGWGERQPGPIPPLPPDVTYVSCSVYSPFAAAIRSDGSLVAWGDNAQGELDVPPLPPGMSYLEVSVSNSYCVARRGVEHETTRVSVDSAGAQGHAPSWIPSISGDGRFVAFYSFASDLVAADNNAAADVFVHDRQTGGTSRVSVGPNGLEANGDSGNPAISADGRWVAFQSYASNLVLGDTNTQPDIFVFDRQTGMTTRVSVDSSGAEADSGCFNPSISADGRFVAFFSLATNLDQGDTNSCVDVFVHDVQSGSTTRASMDSFGRQGNGDSFNPRLSADGRFVAFESAASNLVNGDTNSVRDIFLRDRQSGTTTRVSLSATGAQSNGHSYNASISADGRLVAFESDANNLVADDANTVRDVFVRDRQGSTTQRMSVSSSGAQGNHPSSGANFSADGRFVAFHSAASGFVLADGNEKMDVFVHDRQGGATERVSVSSAGAQADGVSENPVLSADGRFVAFESVADNLVRADSNVCQDVFVHDRGVTPSAFSAFCPGDGSALTCPCANNGSAGHGCQNSAATGGALLSASGASSLAADTLLLSSSDELPPAITLVLQGTTSIAPMPFADGLLCTGGSVRVLYLKLASGGIVNVPQAGEASVSTRSAAMGDTLTPGAVRFYQMDYVDPVMNFCRYPTGGIFNLSNGVRVVWGN